MAAELFRAAAVCPSLRPAVLLEIAAFASGVKPSLRFVVSSADAERICSISKGLGLSAEAQPISLIQRRNGYSEIATICTGISQVLVAIVRGRGARRLLNAELTDPVEAGKLLGYPRCCVEAHARIANASDQWALLLLEGSASKIDARLNRFAAEWGGIGLLGELFPCSLECAAAARYAQSLYDSALCFGLHRLASVAKSDSLTPVYISRRGRISRAAHHKTLEFFW